MQVAWWDLCNARGSHGWPSNPAFKPWKQNGRVGTSWEPIRCVLPVPLHLTGGGGVPDAARSIAGSHLKLTKRCAIVLRKYCQHVRPDLLIVGSVEVEGGGGADDSSEQESHTSGGSEDDKESYGR